METAVDSQTVSSVESGRSDLIQIYLTKVSWTDALSSDEVSREQSR